MNKYLAILIVVCTTCVEAKVLYDKNGVRIEYHCTDTGKHTYCNLSPESDPDYTDKKIKIWKVTLKITNGSGRKIKPTTAGIAWVTVKPQSGNIFNYCSYNHVDNLHKLDGHLDQQKIFFSITYDALPIPPGRTISNSTYLYLYEDDPPELNQWLFDGYRFLEDKKRTPKASQQPAKQAPTKVTPPASKPASKPAKQTPSISRGPSGSLILLIDVSGSMSGTKLSSAKGAAINTIRKALKNKTEIAILTFEGDCTSPIHASIGFSRNESELVAFVKGLNARGGTPLATALEATNRFMNQNKSASSRTQMILLLADGDDGCGNLDAILNQLKQNNLLYRHETVGLEVSGSAQRQLQNIATQSGGKYHSATSQNLSKVFSDAMDLMKMLDMIGKFR